MESDSDSFIDFSDQSYSDNDNDQELQNLKNNLIEQIENFKYEILELYEKHEYLQMLDILRMEVESEYVTRENFKIYCDVLCELVVKFRLEGWNINAKIEKEIKKMRDKVEKIVGFQVKEIERNDEDNAINILFVFTFIFLFLSFIAVGVASLFGGLICLATFGVCIGIISGMWIGYKFIRMFKKWHRNRNLCEISQKSQEIGEKIQENSEREKQVECNSTTITVEQSLFLCIRNNLLIFVKDYNAISAEVSAEVNEICLRDLNDLNELNDEIKIDEIKKVNSIDDLIKLNDDVFNIVKNKLSELQKNFMEKYREFDDNNFINTHPNFLKNFKKLKEISEGLEKICNKFKPKDMSTNTNNEPKPIQETNQTVQNEKRDCPASL